MAVAFAIVIAFEALWIVYLWLQNKQNCREVRGYAEALEDAHRTIQELTSSLTKARAEIADKHELITRHEVEIGRLKADAIGNLDTVKGYARKLEQISQVLNSGCPRATAVLMKPRDTDFAKEVKESLSDLPDDLKYDAYYQFAFNGKMPNPFPEDMHKQESQE